MPLSFAKPKAALAGLALLALSSASTFAADPSPAAVAAATTILTDIGMKKSLDAVVPGMMIELEHNVLGARPELKDSLHQVIVGLVPEFTKSQDAMLQKAATILAGQLSEQELKDVAGFFESASGKKYVGAEPVFLSQFTAAAEAWRQQLSTDILTRVREELKKKGVDF